MKRKSKEPKETMGEFNDRNLVEVNQENIMEQRTWRKERNKIDNQLLLISSARYCIKYFKNIISSPNNSSSR